MTMPSSLQIAQSVRPRPILEIGEELGLLPEELELFGWDKAKVGLGVLERLADRPAAREIVVTAITPTPLGEGKTTTTIGLAQGLNRIGVRTAVAIRQPSLGPVFGIKGGAAGGGYSQIIPMEEFNLHLTGDNHAVGAAHNLAAAFLDNHLHHGNALGIDPYTIDWPRVVDISDRALRHAVIGLGGREDGVPRETEWQISVASEVMAILALATDLQDLRHRLGSIVLAKTRDGRPVTTEELRVAGAMTVLMRDAIKPNLLQTLEGGPAFVHAGPFGNIAHGNSSVLADRIAGKLVDVVCTEAGFGADLGAEKFFDIKCRLGGLRPAAAVVVTTIRALKMHGGVGRIVAGKPLDPALEAEDPDAVRRGAENLAKQIENVSAFNVPCVVAINAFPGDAPSEVAAVQEVALAAGAMDAVLSRHFAEGGAGAEDLARAVWAAAQVGAPEFRLLYPDDAPLAGKIETIAQRIYGADGVDFSATAIRGLEELERLGYGALPICMAKSHLSISHDPNLKGRPRGFRVPVRAVRLYAGAGFVTAYCGDMRTMPGLPSRPAGEGVDIDAAGNIVGLF
ncbi:MAG TPA: formate--tetrahydrofolate ligase [Candidatus Dormibacteraeota bacterium]|nr:formate--tetrahydrofolate ligase [Candidatus Dormibacteraeota bacterium]